MKITKPGRDAKVSPIEEVSVSVEGADDFGLQELSLRYSVNGGPEKSVSFLGQKGAKSSNGTHVIALEDYKLSPGDLVSMYAVARDAQHTAKTDIFFLEAQPYERDYSQSQQGGGGGGGGDQQDNQISERQKEIIAATWNRAEERRRRIAQQAREDARFLGETQGKLGEQAKTLAERMRSRQLTGANQEFQTFAQEMEQASVRDDGRHRQAEGPEMDRSDAA